MPKKDKIMIFIDHNNILHIFMQNDSFRFNYLKLRDIIPDQGNVISTRTYIGVEPLRRRGEAQSGKHF